MYGAASPLLSVVTLFLASYGPTAGTLFALALLRDADETRAWRHSLLTFRAHGRWYVLAVLFRRSPGRLAGIALTTFFGCVLATQVVRSEKNLMRRECPLPLSHSVVCSEQEIGRSSRETEPELACEVVVCVAERGNSYSIIPINI